MFSEQLLNLQELDPKTKTLLFGALLLLMATLYFLAKYVHLTVRHVYFSYQKRNIRSLARMNTARSLNEIANIAKRHQFDIGKYAVSSLQNIGSHDANNQLLGFIGSYLGICARKTLVELARTGYIESFEKKLYSTKDSRVRHEIIDILENAETDDALCVLVNCLAYLNDHDKTKAFEAICKFDNPSVRKLLIGELKHNSVRIRAIEKYLKRNANELDIEDAVTIIQCHCDKTSKVYLENVLLSIPTATFYLAIDKLTAETKETLTIIKTAFDYTQNNIDKKASEQILIDQINKGGKLVESFLPLINTEKVYSHSGNEEQWVCRTNAYAVSLLKNLIMGCCSPNSIHFLVEMVKWPTQTINAKPFRVVEEKREWDDIRPETTIEQYSFEYGEIETGRTVTSRMCEIEKKEYYLSSRPHRKLAKMKLLEIQAQFEDSMVLILPDFAKYPDEGQTFCITSTYETHLGSTYT